MAPSIFSPFFTKKPTKTTPIILRIEKSFQTHPRWHILNYDISKYNSWLSTCTHPRTGLRNMTDATAVLIRHPAKEDGNPEGAQGLARLHSATESWEAGTSVAVVENTAGASDQGATKPQDSWCSLVGQHWCLKTPSWSRRAPTVPYSIM